MDKVRQFLRGPSGKVAVLLLLCAALWGAYMSGRSFFIESSLARSSRDRIFIDASSGKPFHYTIKRGDLYPVMAPSGKKTGYPAEMCYWTADGKIKKDPTPVLLNQYVGKPGPTFCPDCGRRVVAMNPAPNPGDPPPPKKSEYRPPRGVVPAEMDEGKDE
jgi:hypothetical protein